MTKSLRAIERAIRATQTHPGRPRDPRARTAGEANGDLYGSPSSRPRYHSGGPTPNPGAPAAFARNVPVLVVDQHGVTHIVRSSSEYEAALTNRNTQKEIH